MPDDAGLLVAGVSQDVARAALDGLLQPQKSLPARLFYDEEGCRLFQRITELPEYYLTRTERALLTTVAPRVVAELPRNETGAVLVEYGASDEAKAEGLLAARDAVGNAVFDAYVPIDVAAPALSAMATRLKPGATESDRASHRHGFPMPGLVAVRTGTTDATWFLSRIDNRQYAAAGGATLPAPGA